MAEGFSSDRSDPAHHTSLKPVKDGFLGLWVRKEAQMALSRLATQSPDLAHGRDSPPAASQTPKAQMCRRSSASGPTRRTLRA